MSVFSILNYGATYKAGSRSKHAKLASHGHAQLRITHTHKKTTTKRGSEWGRVLLNPSPPLSLFCPPPLYTDLLCLFRHHPLPAQTIVPPSSPPPPPPPAPVPLPGPSISSLIQTDRVKKKKKKKRKKKRERKKKEHALPDATSVRRVRLTVRLCRSELWVCGCMKREVGLGSHPPSPPHPSLIISMNTNPHLLQQD